MENLGQALRNMETPLEAISINLEHELFRQKNRDSPLMGFNDIKEQPWEEWGT